MWIIPHNATFSDWAGSYKGGSFGWGFGSLEGGKSSNYEVLGFGLGPSWGPKGLKGFNGSFMVGTTVLVGQPFYNADHPYTNTYVGELIGNQNYGNKITTSIVCQNQVRRWFVETQHTFQIARVWV